MDQNSGKSREELEAGFARASQLLDELAIKTQEDATLRSRIITEVPGAVLTPEKKPWSGAKSIVIGFIVGFICCSTILTPIVNAVLMLVASIATVVMAPMFGLTLSSEATPEYSAAFGVVTTILSLIVIVIMSLLIALILRIIVNKYIASKNAQIAASNKNAEAVVAEAIKAAQAKNVETVAALEDLSEQMDAISRAWADEVAPWYPMDYATPDACRFMYEALRNYRADTIKEAVNLYETHKHQMRMEAQQQEQTRQAQMATQLQMSLNERMEENNRLMKLNVAVSAVSAVASVATAANTANIAQSAAQTAANAKRTASAASSAASEAKRAADALSRPRQVDVTITRK